MDYQVTGRQHLQFRICQNYPGQIKPDLRFGNFRDRAGVPNMMKLDFGLNIM